MNGILCVRLHSTVDLDDNGRCLLQPKTEICNGCVCVRGNRAIVVQNQKEMSKQAYKLSQEIKRKENKYG